MSGRCGRWWWLAVVVAMLAPAAGAWGQSQLAARGPRFLLAGSKSEGERDASNAPVLRRRVSLDLNGVTVDDALKELSRRAGLELAYSPRVVVLDQPVTLKARDITVAAALTEILLDVAVDVSVTTGGHLALVQRPPLAAPLPADTGAVVGRVTDAQGGSPIVGATVSVDGRRATATTGADGRYRLGGLEAGTYTVRARYIGYTPSGKSVTVGAGEEATVDFALVKSAQELNQVVVTGTIVPTEVKALPTPVTVITSSEIDRQRPHSVQELLRQAIPTGVSWDYPGVPYQTSISMRGATSFSGGSGQAKIFIDGVEVANQTDAALDPYSIERVEVIRGPQAAAVYGTGALGGVIQIFTKRGDPNQKRPQVDAEAGFGVVQTPYVGYGAVFRQDYRASMRGTSGDVSYSVGAGYRHTGDYIPNGEISGQSNPSVYGGIRYEHGIVSLDLSGRYYSHDAPQVFNPDLIQTGFTFFTKPFYLPSQAQNQTVGAQLGIAPTRWWRHTLTAGVDRLNLDAAQAQPRFTTPADTLLEVVSFGYTKTSIGYNTSVQGDLLPGVSASLTAGFDYYRLPVTSWFTFGALNTTGSILLGPNQSFSIGRSITTNTGYFGQVQVGLRDALFLTAGLRADKNSDFGDSLGTPFSPRVGLSYVQRVSAATIKLRGSYGRAIRAPGFGFKLASSSPVAIVLANPSLAPERQQGWDAGVDAAFGSRVSLGLTYYDQTADNLIQYVLLQPGAPAVYQYQNVGRVVNTGIEVEALLDLGPVLLKGQYGYARSRIAQLAPNYGGDLRVGDQSRDTPKHTAGATLTAGLFKGTTLTGGLTYVGSWNDYDYLAEFRCFGGTGPCRATLRDYVMAYPGFVKLNATLFQQLSRQVSGFISVENLTGNNAFELYNRNAVMGRISTVGFRLQY